MAEEERRQVRLKIDISVLEIPNEYLVSFVKDILKVEAINTVVQHLRILLKQES